MNRKTLKQAEKLIYELIDVSESIGWEECDVENSNGGHAVFTPLRVARQTEIRLELFRLLTQEAVNASKS